MSRVGNDPNRASNQVTLVVILSSVLVVLVILLLSFFAITQKPAFVIGEPNEYQKNTETVVERREFSVTPRPNKPSQGSDPLLTQ